MKQLTSSLISAESRDSVSTSLDENLSTTPKKDTSTTKSVFPSRKSIIIGIYKKLQSYLEEVVDRRQTSLLEKKTPAKPDFKVVCMVIQQIENHSLPTPEAHQPKSL